eukprot:6204484-Pleurochrysis_carterae.AAC.1
MTRTSQETSRRRRDGCAADLWTVLSTFVISQQFLRHFLAPWPATSFGFARRSCWRRAACRDALAHVAGRRE